MFNQEMPLGPEQAAELARSRLSGFVDSDFELAERIVAALSELPQEHALRADPEVSEFCDFVNSAGDFVAKLPAQPPMEYSGSILDSAGGGVLMVMYWPSTGGPEVLTGWPLTEPVVEKSPPVSTPAAYLKVPAMSAR